MRILCVIPARAGSKRLPDKNIADLGGKPLIQWSIDIGLKTCSAGVVVSTDGHAIADLARDGGATHIVLRPAALASDAASSEDTVRHAVADAQRQGVGEFDAVLLLQPTSPFRTEADVLAAVRVMEDNGADSVISVVAFQERDALFRLGWGGRLRPGHTPQDMVYRPNGAIYLISAATLADDWYGVGAYAYRMPLERSLDIDTHADMDAARAALQA